MAKLVLKKMQLENFQGVKNQTIDFGEKSTIIKGQNGAGKSTTANAWYWLFADSNYALAKNPPITPLGMNECISKVMAEIEIDGRPCTVEKSQKYKEKMDDSGKVTSSITNSYAINTVEKSYKDFVAEMTERGLDIERFLIFSHPNAFTLDNSKAGREKMRNTLFEMAEDISDADIAKEIDVPELSVLLDTYRLDEVESMNKSTIRTIIENNGKNNEVINAKIDGMLSSKAVVDLSALTAEKASLEKDIDDLKGQIASIGDKKSEITAEITRLEKEKKQILEKANEDIKTSLGALDTKLVQLDHERAILCANYDLAANEVNSVKHEISLNEEHLNNWRDLYKKVQDEVLDNKDLKCPTCGTEYPADRIEEIKANFESSKNERLNSYKARGEESKANIEKLNSALEEAEKNHSRLHDDIANIDKQMESVKAEISMSPAEVTKNDETDAIDVKIAELEETLKKDNSEIAENINEQIFSKRNKLQEVIGQIAVGERNADVDKKVEELREERRNAEVNKAKAEKIIDQVERFKKYKNDKLTESINKHFSLIKWRLFKTLKNSKVEDDCEPLIDDKPISSCCNGSLITLAKISICADLGRYFNEFYPIWSDDYSLMSSNTSNRVNVDSQFIGLMVTEDKELQIEKGE